MSSYVCVCIYTHTSELVLRILVSFSNNPTFMRPDCELYWHRTI